MSYTPTTWKAGDVITAAKLNKLEQGVQNEQVGPQGDPGPAGADGAPGADGLTPTIGDNGNWFLGDTDTGKPSRGEAGPTGADGAPGAPGADGADGVGVPAGGTAGQILGKVSDVDYDTAWVDPPSGGDGGAGTDGVGIQSMEQTTASTESGGLNVWTATLTDGSTYDLEVRNGAAGKDGEPGADGAPGADGITPTIGENGNWYLSAEDTGKPSRGEAGPAGADGVGIASVEQTVVSEESGGINETTVTLTNGEKAVIQTRNGKGGGADLTLSNLSDPAAALANLGARSNPNLIDNWYLADPIDQKRGYFVPAGTAYYSDTALTTSAGTLTVNASAFYVDETYGTIIVSNVTYYVAFADMVRGYGGLVPSFDRWRIIGGNSGLPQATAENGTAMTFSVLGNSTCVLRQRLSCSLNLLVGKTVTLSVLLANGELHAATGVIPDGTPSENVTICRTILGDDETNSPRFACAWFISGGTDINVQFGIPSEASENTISAVAVKLEVSDHQTLAHQDADGNWILNDIPDPDAELLKCQKYYQLFSSEDKVPTSLADYRPAMRTTPTTGPISIDGQTYYFADAQL